MAMTDSLNRPLRDLRISVTDRCNLRCEYCMPGDRTYHFMPKKELLNFEEITTVASIFAEAGVEKLRLTGGEPLLRRDLPELIRFLSEIKGIKDVALTTNGVTLARWAQPLAEAGLRRITVSLDSLDQETYAKMSGHKASVQAPLKGIRAATAAGLPVKINTVVQRGINDAELLDMVRFGRDHGHVVRFIEFMDVGNLNEWKKRLVISAVEIRDRINQAFPCEPVAPDYPGEVARRYRFKDGQGEFGIIASVSQPFCRSCTRARISADGQLYTCLFSGKGHDLKTRLRESGRQSVADLITHIWTRRDDRYSELRNEDPSVVEKVEMFQIGG